MNEFESMIIIDPALTPEEAENENKKFCDFIKENEGEIINTDIWGKKVLAFEIDNKKEGYFFINYFKINGSQTTKTNRYYKLNEKIFRYNLLTGSMSKEQ